jgi:hypothetical protein
LGGDRIVQSARRAGIQFKEKFGLEWVGGPPQTLDQIIADAIRESRRDLDAGAPAQYMADALNTINLNQGAEREAKSDDKASPKSDPRLLTLLRNSGSICGLQQENQQVKAAKIAAT